MKRYFLLFIKMVTLSCHFVLAQSNLAVLEYEEAEAAYNNANYNKALQLIEEVEDIYRVTSGTLYLKIVAKDKLFKINPAEELSDPDKQLLGDLRRHTRLYIEAMQEQEVDDNLQEVYRISKKLDAYPELAPDPANYASVEIQPAPPGGELETFANWVAENYVIPEAALRAKVNGTVKVWFVVERDGSLSEIDIVHDLGHGTGKELVRVLRQSDRWRPGIQNGRPVRVGYAIPINLNTPQ